MFGLFKRKGALTAAQIDQTFERAVERLRGGDGLGAEREVHAVVEQAAQTGTDSPLYAKALFNEAMILIGVGDLSRAVAVCKQAAAVPGKDYESRKDRLTYLMNVGDILTRMGQLDEAEQVLRDSLEERRQFYGTEHAGYAYGLSSLAELLLARGNAQDALLLVEKAVAILLPSHEHLPSNLVIRALAVKGALGSESPAFADWPSLHPGLRQAVVQDALGRVEVAEPGLLVAVLSELQARMAEMTDTPGDQAYNILASIANVARLAGDHEARIRSTRQAIELARSQNDISSLANTYEGLAMALSDAGQDAEAERAYEDALQVATDAGDHRSAANAFRNYAIWMDQRGEKERAADLHRRGVESAARSGDKVMHGRALCAYGIFVQHAGDPQQAQPLLAQAVSLLPASDASAFYAQNHLNAMRHGQSCGCDENADETFSMLVERQVMEHAPEGLLKSIKIHMTEEGPEVTVETAREPSEKDLEELNRIINQTLAHMRQEYRREGYS